MPFSFRSCESLTGPTTQSSVVVPLLYSSTHRIKPLDLVQFCCFNCTFGGAGAGVPVPVAGGGVLDPLLSLGTNSMVQADFWGMRAT
jgi:hypothetical protein